MHPFYLVLGSLWCAPIIAALALAAAKGVPRALFVVICLAGGALGLVILAMLLKVSFMARTANVQALCFAYFAYCLLALGSVRLRPPLLGKLALATACLPIAFGYLLGTIGALGLAFLVGDAVRAPLHERSIGGGVVCVVTKDDGIGDTSYHLTLQQRWGPLPIQRRLAQSDAIDVSPEEELHCSGSELNQARPQI